MIPENINQTDFYNKIKDTTAYKTAYKKTFDEQIAKEQNDISEIEEEIMSPRRTRTQKKQVRMSNDVTDRSRDRERDRMKRQLEELNAQMPDFGDFENFYLEEEMGNLEQLRKKVGIEEF